VRKAYRKYKDRGFAVIGVHRHSSEVTEDQITAFLDSHGVEFPFALDTGETFKSYDTDSWPTRILIDREGKVRKGVLIWDKLDGPIEELLAE